MKTTHIIGIMGGVLLIMGATVAQAYTVGEVQHGGTIQGHVTFSGTPPTPLRFAVEKNPEICGQERSLMKVETHNGGLTGAVVVLEGVQTGKPFPEQAFTGHLPGEGEFDIRVERHLDFRSRPKDVTSDPLRE